MKWKNKGHEIDNFALEICNIFDQKKGVIVYGAGNVGTRIYRALKRYDLFHKFVDNDTQKQKSGYMGEQVVGSDQIIDGGYLLVVAVADAYKQVSEQLQKIGLEEDKDFVNAELFENKWLPTLLYYRYQHLYTNLAQICVTERCTLKCKKCAHACNVVAMNEEDMPLDIAKKSADVFFSKYDCVGEFVLIGGEPLLYKNLIEIVEYIGSKYGSKIILFSITTNGTIIPSDELIKICMRYNVMIRISDYSASVPRLKNNYQKLYDKLKDLCVEVWKTNAEDSWFDYGFDQTDLKKSIKDVMQTFEHCKTQCREISGEKYYYCVMAHTVAKNRNYNIGKVDYIDLSDVKDRKILLEFELGYNDKGFLDMCRICRGKEAELFLIPAAEQEGTIK